MSPSQPLRILLLDDAPDAPATLEEHRDWSSVRARSRDEAAARAAAGDLDAVLVDARGGVALVRECRARGVVTPIIVLTRPGDEQAAGAAMDAGAADHLAREDLRPEVLRLSLRHARDRERRFRHAEDVAHASEEHLRQIARIGNDVVWSLDLATGVCELSEPFETVFGYRERSLPDALAWWWPRVHADDRDRVRARFEQMLAGAARSWQEEYRFQRADGTWVHVLDRAYVVPDAGGRAARVVGTLIDLTYRVRQEEELRQAAKMEAIGRLAGGVAHDFNNLLTAIIGYSELLVAQLAPGPQRRAVEQVRLAGQRAAALTHQLLAFSRKQVLQPEALDLNRVVADVKDMLTRLIGEHIEVRTDLAPDLGRVCADRAQLEQVIVNLAVNARDAMPRGGTLSISTRRAAPVGPALAPGATLIVSDTGHGMTPDVLAHVFEPFFTTKAVGKGTGLGLSTVYGIVKQSGGDVEVRSAPDAGTTFSITLPTAEATTSSTHRRSGTAVVPGGRETILVVEDEDAVRQLVTEVLTSRGYHVLAAARGEEALALAGTHDGPIHLVLTDVVMPGLSGTELASRLSGLKPGLRILFMSGYTGEPFALRDEVGAVHQVLDKPFTPVHLAAAVRHALDGAAE